MRNNFSSRDILEKIKRHQISPEEGAELYGNLQKEFQYSHMKLKAKEKNPIYYCTNWEKSQVKQNSSDKKMIGWTLIFDDNESLFHEWRESRKGDKEQVILVTPAERYQVLDDGRYRMNPTKQQDYQLLLAELESRGQMPNRIIHNWSKTEKNSSDVNMFYSVFYLIQILTSQKSAQQVEILYLYSTQGDEIRPQCAAISGFAKAVRLENPNFLIKTVELHSISQFTYAPSEICEIALDEFERENLKLSVRYENGIRYAKNLLRYQPTKVNKKTGLKKNGVYLITGGIGGLGLIFAEYLADKVKAKLVLAGRSPLTPETKRKLEELEVLGAEVLYVQTDITNIDAVMKLIDETKYRFGQIHGVIHSAGVIQDSFVLKKTQKEIKQVLAPKLYGTLNLDEATKNENLDFFVLFSSITALIGNVGQSDYAYANSFMDYFVEVRRKKNHPGKSLSLNWPFWKSGGMKISPESIDYMKSTTGLSPLSTDVGLEAFEEGIQSSISQLLVVEGDTDKIERAFAMEEESKGKEQSMDHETISLDLDKLQGKTVTYLKNILSKEIKLPVHKIDAREALEKYGIDSVMVMNLTRELEKYFGELSKTLFFEYQTINELATYFVENHRKRIVKTLGTEINLPIKKHIEEKRNEVKKQRVLKRSQFLQNQEEDLRKKVTGLYENEIAIIGVSGRYPMANNLEEYWRNLQSGKDCITEIPFERWDYRKHFDSDKRQQGKAYGKWGGFINDVDKFDPLFFNISPREAESMDPQERLFLETAWQTIEDAGYIKKDLGEIDKIGVYVGVMYGHYQLYGAEEALKNMDFVPSSSFASIANRISYHMNFRGPSMAVDTMCSSSLTSIHLACESIRNGECEVAIAGGVNVSIHPNKYLQLSKGNFLSTDGRCRSFGEAGDGYVPGEGVGAVLLKPLNKAIKDGDYIYAVIKGTSLNHGGKTNGYTVPNPNAQADLILKTLKKADVNPRTISYIEAHGTGTSLGDPIEITGLSKAFSTFNNEKSYCAIGSVKSNIGHLESAAGIAALTKVLLQMKFKQMVPSIHSNIVNPNINFEGSPFYIQHQLEEWKQPVIEEENGLRTYPRRAGISSFGAGGSNAHLIIEEYHNEHRLSASSVEKDNEPRIFVLSAKTEEQLYQYIQLYIEFLKNTSISLCDLTYTLQVGREEMEERLAIVILSKQELIEKLCEFALGKEAIDGVYRGNIKDNQNTRGLLVEGEEGKEFIRLIVTKRKFSKLATLWTLGEDIDWDFLYVDEIPHRISLPVYPFAREQYWVPQVENISMKNIMNQEKISTIHPLLDSNESTLQEQCFKKVFNRNSLFLRDYLVDEEKIIPSLVCLEMARAAGDIANPNQQVTKLKDMVWSQPLSLKQDTQEVWIHLHPDEKQVSYEISTKLGSKRIAHVQGKLIYEEHSNQFGKKINFDEIQLRLKEKKNREECYSSLAAHHLQYGKELQVIEELHINEKEALSQLQYTRNEDIGEFELHPALMEGAIQTAFALAIHSEKVSAHPYLLYALDEVEIIRPLSEKCYAHVIMDSEDAIKKFNIYLYDGKGNLAIVMKQLQLVATHKVEENVSSDFRILSKDWKESVDEQIIETPSMGVLIMIVNEESYLFANNLKNILPGIEGIILHQKELQGTNVLNIDSQKIKQCIGLIDLSDMYSSSVEKCSGNINKIVLLQELIKNVQYDSVFILHLTQGLQDFKEEQSTLAGADIAGLIKMLGAEYKKVRAKTVDVDVSLADSDVLKKIIADEIMMDSLESEVCYRSGKRYVPYMKENIAKKHAMSMLEVDCDKVFVVTGGMRGIGAEIARYLVKKGARKLVLMGVQPLPSRSQWHSMLNESNVATSMRDRLNLVLDLEKQGIQVEVYTGSLTDEQKLRIFFNRIREQIGEIGGVVHCAGLALEHEPAFIKKKSEDISKVFEPKIIGVQTLHEIFAEDQLNFFVLFSSVSALIPKLGVGVSDYATANSFMDYFVTYQHRMGKTFYKSINWPSWKEVGIGEVKSFAYQQTGLLAHITEDGLSMFDQVMKLPHALCTPCMVDSDRFNIETLLWLNPQKEQESSKSALQKNVITKHLNPSQEVLITKEWLKEFFSKELRIPIERLDENTDFGDFGVDSILLIDLVRGVEERLNMDLDPSIFLEYPTLTLLSGYLIENHKGNVRNDRKESTIFVNEMEESKAREISKLSSTQKVGTSQFLIKPVKELKPYADHTFKRFNTTSSNENASEKVAVIGIGCHFPGAKDKESFWENLSTGQSKITEVPQSRWGVERFYAPDYQDGKSISKWGGFIEDIEYFDPKYFNFRVEDAPQIDPLIRQFLEVSTQTLRDAGYEQKELANRKVGVFVGSRVADYSSRITKLQKSSIIGIGQNFIGAHLSHFFNFKGPNIVIDTACSSSLVSIHLACKSLMTGESDIALAGGVDILLDENPYLILSEARALSPDGKCHTFDAKANGFVPGEGCGAVLLKPLERAIKDGDQIYAVIDASAINNDGRTMGVTTPNGEEQQTVIKEALRIGKINPSSISYIETHGTGTMIGDPIELKSLTKVFREFTKEKRFCGVGSVKTNIGHLLSAAGIASFIKVVLSLYHKKIPPTLNCETPNKRFEFSESPFYPNVHLSDWEQREGIRRAGISSFGFGGTNAHIIVSEIDQQLISGYKQKRTSLSPVKFNRTYYWLDKEDIISKGEGNLPSLFEFEMS